MSFHGGHHSFCRKQNVKLRRSWWSFVLPLFWSLLRLWLITMNPHLIARYVPLQQCFSLHLVALQVVERCHHSCGLLTWHQLFWHPPSTNLPKLEMIIDQSVHWISWNTRVMNNIRNWHTSVRPYEFIDCCNPGIGCHHNMPARLFLVINTFSVISKLRTPSMYCWSRKTFVTIHGMHFTANSTCIMSFSPQKNEQWRAVPYGKI